MTAQEAPEKPLSELSRIVNVFVSPKEAFTDILPRPRWYIPVIILTVLSLVVVYCISQRIGWEHIVRQSIEQSSRASSIPAEQKEQQIAMGAKVASVIGYVQGTIGPLLGVVIISGVLMFIANAMLGTQLRYAQMMGITAYSMLTGLISIPLMIVVMYMKSPEDFDLRNPLAFNVGAFLNAETTPKWLTSLGSSFDLFSFWTMLLLAIGISCAGRKLTVGKAFGAVLIPWAVWVVCKTGWAALFS